MRKGILALSCDLLAFATSLLAAAVTLLRPDWIETVFRADPDHGSGAVEWAIVGCLLVTSLVSGVAARRAWMSR